MNAVFWSINAYQVHLLLHFFCWKRRKRNSWRNKPKMRKRRKQNITVTLKMIGGNRRSHVCTAIVFPCSQVLEHGWLIISSSKKAGLSNLEFINPRKSEEGLQNQIRKCTVSKYLLPNSDLGIQKYMKQVQKVFYKCIHFCHSQLHFNHAIFHAPKCISEKYDNVALKLDVGLTLRSASAF